jgi:hypothetical protein
MNESTENLVGRISRDLQKLEDLLKVSGDEKPKIRFPRGVLRSASSFRNGYWFIDDKNLRTNIAYALILSDTYRWMINRTDLVGTAREMLIKEGICLMGCLAESITKHSLRGICGKKQNYQSRINKMLELKIIDKALHAKLKWLWDYRNREHLFLLTEAEYNHDKAEHYNCAIAAVEGLRSSLEQHFRKDAK